MSNTPVTKLYFQPRYIENYKAPSQSDTPEKSKAFLNANHNKLEITVDGQRIMIDRAIGGSGQVEVVDNSNYAAHIRIPYIFQDSAEPEKFHKTDYVTVEVTDADGDGDQDVICYAFLEGNFIGALVLSNVPESEVMKVPNPKNTAKTPVLDREASTDY